MVRFTKLAVLVSMAMQSFCSMGSSDLSQNQFEQLIEKIPDDSVREKVEGLYESKNYGELEFVLLDYVDEYVESSFAGDDKEAIEKSKESLKEMIDTFLEKKTFEEDLLKIDNSPMSIVSRFVKDMKSPEKQAEAAELLSEGTYTKLADLIYEYIDEIELGDSEKDEILASVDPAIQDLIMESFGDGEEENEEDDTPMGKVNAFIKGMNRNKEEAMDLAKDEKYSHLEDLVYEYLDTTEMDLGEKHTMLMSVHSALRELMNEQRKKEQEELLVQDVEEEPEEVEEEEEESSENDNVIDLQKVVDDIPDEDKRTEVQALLGERNYKELKASLEDYIDTFDGITESGKEEFKNNVDDAIIAMRFQYNEFEEGSHFEVDLTLQKPVIDVTELIEEMKDEEERARARMFYDERQYHELQDVLAGHIFSLDDMEESEKEELLANMESASETLIENDKRNPEYVVSENWKKCVDEVEWYIDEFYVSVKGTNVTEAKKHAKFLLGRKYFSKVEEYTYNNTNMGDGKLPGDMNMEQMSAFQECIGDLIEMDDGMIGNTENNPKFEPITIKLKNGVSNEPVKLEDMVEGVDYFEIDEKEEVHLSELTDLIVDIPDNEAQGEAFELLHKKQFGDLEEHLFSYLDKFIDGLEGGDEKQKMLDHKAEIKKKLDVAIKYQTDKANGVFEEEEDEEKEQLLEVDGFRAFAFNQVINSIPEKEIRDSMIEKIRSENYDEAEIMFKEYLNTYLSKYEPNDSENTWGDLELLSEYISDAFKRMSEKRAEPEPEFPGEVVNADEDGQRRMNENESGDESDAVNDAKKDGLDMGVTDEDNEMEKNFVPEDMKDELDVDMEEEVLSEPELREHVKDAIGRIVENHDKIDELITSFINANVER